MQYTINQLYNDIHQKVFNIYDVFKNFFGEENVDLQLSDTEQNIKNGLVSSIITNLNKPLECTEEGYNKEFEIIENALERIKSDFSEKKVNIYVWWRKVTITNEYDKSVDIQDLYARIGVQLNGRIPYENQGFLLNRATYPIEQFISNYMHSHICDIPKEDFSRFQRPCLGKGPIIETIGTLKNEYDEVTWMLFCQELSMYVTVESLTGGPYHKLESIGRSNTLETHRKYDFSITDYDRFSIFYTYDKLKDFIKYYIEHGHLTLSYKRGKFTYGMPYFDYIIDVSNAFIDYHNKYLSTSNRRLNRLYNEGLLYKTVILNKTFYQNDLCKMATVNVDNYNDKHVLTFKGKDIRTKILDLADTSNATLTTIIDHNLAMYILKNILRIINFRYKNEHNNTTSTKDLASACKRVCYI